MSGRKPLGLCFRVLFLGTLALGVTSIKGSAAPYDSADAVVTVETTWSVDRARPGDLIDLAIVAAIKEGYHIN
ncbi:MAG: hypothetical protein V3S89_04875, partial [Desulfobacterales bacterium]